MQCAWKPRKSWFFSHNNDYHAVPGGRVQAQRGVWLVKLHCWHFVLSMATHHLLSGEIAHFLFLSWKFHIIQMCVSTNNCPHNKSGNIYKDMVGQLCSTSLSFFFSFFFLNNFCLLNINGVCYPNWIIDNTMVIQIIKSYWSMLILLTCMHLRFINKYIHHKDRHCIHYSSRFANIQIFIYIFILIQKIYLE